MMCALEHLLIVVFKNAHYTCSNVVYINSVIYKLRSEGNIFSIKYTVKHVCFSFRRGQRRSDRECLHV